MSRPRRRRRFIRTDAPCWQSLRGFHAEIIFADEAAYIGARMFTAGILPVAQQKYSCLIMTTTPGPPQWALNGECRRQVSVPVSSNLERRSQVLVAPMVADRAPTKFARLLIRLNCRSLMRHLVTETATLAPAAPQPGQGRQNRSGRAQVLGGQRRHGAIPPSGGPARQGGGTELRLGSGAGTRRLGRPAPERTKSDAMK